MDDIKFSVVVRMMWIDDLVDEEGQIGRGDICRAFNVSIPQASVDLRKYMAANPSRIAYDKSLKCYTQIEGSRPLFRVSARAAAAEIVREFGEISPATALANHRAG